MKNQVSKTALEPLQEFINLAVKSGQLGCLEHIVSRGRTATEDTKLEITFSVWIDDMDFDKFAEILIIMNRQLGQS